MNDQKIFEQQVDEFFQELSNPSYKRYAIGYHHGIDLTCIADDVCFFDGMMEFHIDCESLFGSVTIHLDDITSIDHNDKGNFDIVLTSGEAINVYMFGFDDDEEEEEEE